MSSILITMGRLDEVDFPNNNLMITKLQIAIIEGHKN
jgi:hypothetical protein